MGAVPGGRLLTETIWFDVEPLRTVGHRRVTVRLVDHPALVLGSTQKDDVVDRDAAEARGVTVLRRRSGGGAVLVEPGAVVWLDAWVPREDPLWRDDVMVGAEWVGRWWTSALGLSADHVHRGKAVPAEFRGGELVCFAGVGPGEVVVGGRKVVGVAQWRSREGCLLHTCALRWWEPRGLLDLLALSADARAWLSAALPGVAFGLDDLALGSFGPDALLDALPWDRDWEVVAG